MLKVHYDYNWEKNLVKLTHKKTQTVFISHLQETSMLSYLVGPRVYKIFPNGDFLLDWESSDYGKSENWECLDFPIKNWNIEKYELA